MLYPKGLFVITPSTGILALPVCLMGAAEGGGTPGTPSPVRAQGPGGCMAGGWGRFPGGAAAMPARTRARVHSAESARPDRRCPGAVGGTGSLGGGGSGGADGAAPGPPPAAPEVVAPMIT